MSRARFTFILSFGLLALVIGAPASGDAVEEIHGELSAFTLEKTRVQIHYVAVWRVSTDYTDALSRRVESMLDSAIRESVGRTEIKRLRKLTNFDASSDTLTEVNSRLIELGAEVRELRLVHVEEVQ